MNIVSGVKWPNWKSTYEQFIPISFIDPKILYVSFGKQIMHIGCSFIERMCISSFLHFLDLLVVSHWT